MSTAPRVVPLLISSLISGFMYRQEGHYLTPRQVIGSILCTVCTDCHCSLHGMEAELELLVFASWHGVKLVPIPIQVYYPPRNERVSHFRPGKDFARISVLNTVLCFLAVVYGLPLRLWRTLMTFLRTAYSLLFFLFFTLVVFTPFVWIYTKVGKMTERRRYRLHQLIYHASRFVMIHHGIPGTKYEYKVAEGIDFNKPRIIICNHQSHLDLMCQLVFTPRLSSSPCLGMEQSLLWFTHSERRISTC